MPTGQCFSVDDYLPIGKPSPKAARKMPGLVPKSLRRVEPGWKHISKFRFHAEVKDVPLYAVLDHLWKIIFSNNAVDPLFHQRNGHGLNLLNNCIPRLEAYRGSLRNTLAVLVGGFQTE